MHANNNSDWYLEGALGAQKTVVIPLVKPLFTIGRHADCDLSLPSHEISRLHAKISIDNNRVRVEDCGSTNGTYVNRKRIEQGTVIQEGDVLHFSSIEFRLRKTLQQAPQVDEEDDKTFIAALRHPERQLPEQFVKYEAEFLELLKNEAIQPYCQPIIGLVNQQIAAYEVLGRGAHPKLPKSPYHLFNMAEKLGYAEQLSRMFRHVAITHAVKHIDKYPMLFLNLHPQEMYKNELIVSLEQIRDIAPTLAIVLEVNEKAVTQADDMHALLEIFRKYDFKLAYDDFGAGQSRLTELIEIPPDFLKFDINLVKDIDKSEKKLNLVKSLVELCDNFGIATLAEGVETQGEADTCRQIGFGYIQGYLYGEPQTM